MTSPTTTQHAADPIQSYLDRGLRNYWYPVAPSWQVGDAPIGITRLGDQIVLWRDKGTYKPGGPSRPTARL